MSRQQVQHIVAELAISTLANLTALTVALPMDAARENGVRMKKLMLAINYRGKTASEGPLRVGLCDSTLNVTEIKEALEADPQFFEDIPASEEANRRVFTVWTIPAGLVADEHTQRIREVHYPWKDVQEGQGIKVFVFNDSGATMTTGMVLTVTGVAVQEWLRD